MRRPDRSPGFMSFWPVRLLPPRVPRCQGTDDAPAALSVADGNELSATRESPGVERELSSPLEGWTHSLLDLAQNPHEARVGPCN